MRRVYIVLLLLSVYTVMASDNLFPLMGEKQLEKIQKDGYIVENKVNLDLGLKLLPQSFLLKEEFYTDIRSYNPDQVIEILYRVDRSLINREKDVTRYLQERLLAYSEQVGLEYYSFNRKKMHPLITDSYFIEGDILKKKYKTEDPKINSLIPVRSYTIYQKDTTFGGNYYTLNSRIEEDVIWNQMVNISSLNVFKVFNALKEEELKVDYMIIPHENDLYIYSAVQMKNPPQVESILGKKINILDSVRKRVDVVIKWYIENITN